MSVVSDSDFGAAVAAAAYLHSLRVYRAVLWTWSSESESWTRVSHNPHAGFLRSVAQVMPTQAYLISEEYVDIKGKAYDAAGNRLGAQPVDGMLREAHKAQWVNPQGPDPFPWLRVTDVDGASCNAPFGIPTGWVQDVVTVTSTLAVAASAAEEEEEVDNEEDDTGMEEDEDDM